MQKLILLLALSLIYVSKNIYAKEIMQMETFSIDAIPGDTSLEQNISYQNEHTKYSTKYSFKGNILKGIYASVQTMLRGREEWAVLNEATSSISVSASAVRILQVSRFIDDQNELLRKLVDVKIQFYLSVNSKTNLSAMCESISEGYQYLPESDTYIVTTRLKTNNFQPMIEQFINQRAYLASTSNTILPGSGRQLSLSPQIVNSGITMSIFPSIDYNNDVIMRVAFSLSKLNNINDSKSGDMHIQLPNLNSFNTIVPTHYSNGKPKCILSQSNWYFNDELMNGSQMAIVITPYVSNK